MSLSLGARGVSSRWRFTHQQGVHHSAKVHFGLSFCCSALIWHLSWIIMKPEVVLIFRLFSPPPLSCFSLLFQGSPFGTVQTDFAPRNSNSLETLQVIHPPAWDPWSVTGGWESRESCNGCGVRAVGEQGRSHSSA